ncbi:MAG: hypothetical protein GY918_12705 [Gammaproteobacteria bacterium]|nr:hypothetical protein [Gammaproteobacteria bacterium]
MDKDQELEVELIKTVFSTDAGQKLLDMWAMDYVLTPIFHNDANIMYASVGMQEFVQNIILKKEQQNG